MRPKHAFFLFLTLSLVFFDPDAFAAWPFSNSIPAIYGQKEYDAAKADITVMAKQPSVAPYLVKAFNPFLSPLLARFTRACLKPYPQPSGARFDFILGLSLKGDVTRLYIPAASDFSSCVGAKLLATRMPAPPFLPFLEEINLAIAP